MLELQLTPLNVEEQQLSSELCLDNGVIHFNSKTELCPPNREKSFQQLVPMFFHTGSTSPDHGKSWNKTHFTFVFTTTDQNTCIIADEASEQPIPIYSEAA